MQPSEHAAALIAHYLRELTIRAGLRWTAANDADMETLADLLGQCEAEPALDAIPPFTAPVYSDRVTQVFERDPVEAAAEIARQGRRRYSEDDDARRMLRRERGQ